MTSPVLFWDETHSQVDKSTLGFSAILGLFTETKITKAEYNNLQTFFYVGGLTR